MNSYLLFLLILSIITITIGLTFIFICIYLHEDFLRTGLALIAVGLFLIYIRKHIKSNVY